MTTHSIPSSNRSVRSLAYTGPRIHLAKLLSLGLAAALLCIGAAAQTSLPPTLTPAPVPAPRITGPQIYGAYPSAPFVFLITASGAKPATFSVSGLPAGLSVNSSTGLITGSVAQRGTFDTTVTVANSYGTANRPLRIVIGDQVGLSPSLGWNPFNTYQSSFDDKIVRQNAAAIVSSGLIDFGYQYVNLDEGWEGARSTSAPYSDTNPGPLTANSKFPDFPGLISYVHGLNLKFGVYSTPRAVGYVGFTGGTYVTQSTGENLLASPQDVQQFVDWGVDYLKYDGDDEGAVDFQTTSASVRSATRDIVYSVSQSTGGNFGEASTLSKVSNSWRAAYDMNDQWSSVLQDFQAVPIGNNGAVKVLPSDWAPYTGPGRFADLDMLVEGQVGTNGTLRQSNLLPDEQYTHFTIVSLIASPILMGNELTQLDQFTQGLFANAEVLDVDQDPLGLQATLKTSSNGSSGTQVWSRPLADGSVAVGLFNLSGSSVPVTVNWSDIGVNGTQDVRDLWRQQDLGNFNGSFTATVNTHGVVFIKLTPTASPRPQITGQPVNAYVQEGQAATFSVAATGNNLTYQWTKNGVAIDGANSATYTTPATAYSDDGSYFRVIVNDASNTGRVYSYETRLKVYGASTTDLALKQPTTASGSNFAGAYPASNAVDGSTNSDWWGLHIDPSWLYVDLGANYNINEIKILTDVSSSFRVQVAPEGSNNLNSDAPWTTVGSASGINSYGNISDFTGLSGFGRYVRFDSLSRFATGQYDLPTIHELYVYGSYTNGQTGTGGNPSASQVNLSSASNAIGITNDNVGFSGGGIDGDGYVYSAQELGSSLTDSGGTLFNFGVAGQNDVVTGSNAPSIALTQGKYSTLKFLGLGVNGNQSGTFTVTYSDNSSDQFPVGLSDWFASAPQSQETVAGTYSYRDNNQGAQAGGPLNIYEYVLPLNNSKTVSNLTLPNNRNIVVVAVTLLP